MKKIRRLDDVIKGLKCCTEYNYKCDECPYKTKVKDKNYASCDEYEIPMMQADALFFLKKYKENIKKDETIMPEYHINCGLDEIYAGVFKKNSTEWETKTPVTQEAIEAVRNYLFMKIKNNDSFSYSWDLNSNEKIELLVKITKKGEN